MCLHVEGHSEFSVDDYASDTKQINSTLPGPSKQMAHSHVGIILTLGNVSSSIVNLVE